MIYNTVGPSDNETFESKHTTVSWHLLLKQFDETTVNSKNVYKPSIQLEKRKKKIETKFMSV